MNAVQRKVVQDKIVAVMFEAGWGQYCDLCIAVNTRVAYMVLERCIDYCNSNLKVYVASLERIASAASNNPDGVDGVSDIIMRLGLDVYTAVLDNSLFEIGPRDLPYQLAHIGPAKLYLQRIEI